MTTSNTKNFPRTDSLANKTAVFRGLLKELLQGRWKEANRLTEMEACERFGVSRTPVREAFIELQDLGLLEIRRFCGAVVFPFGSEELTNLFAVRTLLEMEVYQLAVSRANPTDVLALTECGEVSVGSWEQDEHLHRYIAEASGNRILAAGTARYQKLLQTFRIIIEDSPKLPKVGMAGGHLEIIESLKMGKPSEAWQQHLDQEVELMVAAMAAYRENDVAVNEPALL